jgi:hypothetical protein
LVLNDRGQSKACGDKHLQMVVFKTGTQLLGGDWMVGVGKRADVFMRTERDGLSMDSMNLQWSSLLCGNSKENLWKIEGNFIFCI